jgi:hypothetical protein
MAAQPASVRIAQCTFTWRVAFGAAGRLTKTRNDLTGRLYADSIHDSLYRSAGRTLAAMSQDDRPLPPRVR